MGHYRTIEEFCDILKRVRNEGGYKVKINMNDNEEKSMIALAEGKSTVGMISSSVSFYVEHPKYKD